MLWDSLKVLETLGSIRWACENHVTVHKPVPTDLHVIIHRLEQQVPYRNLDMNTFHFRLQTWAVAALT
jgi:hypothetical protein